MELGRIKFSLPVLLGAQFLVGLMIIVGLAGWRYCDPYYPANYLQQAGALARPKGEYQFGLYGEVIFVNGISTRTKYRLKTDEVTGIFIPDDHLEKTWNKSVVIPALKRFPNLEALFLPNTDCDDRDVAQIAQLENLRFLDLERTLITDAGLKDLEACESLEILAIRDTKVTDKGLVKFQDARPDVELVLWHR